MAMKTNHFLKTIHSHHLNEISENEDDDDEEQHDGVTQKDIVLTNND
jgi:hypothetical protein